MTPYLIDLNVWLAIVWEGHVFSEAAIKWLNSLDGAGTRLLFCRVTQLGLIRMLANRQVVGDSVVSVGAALVIYDALLEDPRVEYVPEPAGVDAALRQTLALWTNLPATNTVMDAYLLAVAERAQATFVTFDKALVKAAKQRSIPVAMPR